MKKLFLTTMMLGALSSLAFAETLTLTTYYPAPFGAYDQVRLVPRATLFGSCDVGTLYVNQAGQIQYCRDESGVGTWGFLIGPWTQNGNSVYLTNSSSAVGVGTNSPGAKLHVMDSGTGTTEVRMGNQVNSFASPGFSGDSGISITGTNQHVGLFMNGSGPTGIAMYKNGTSGAIVAYDNQLVLRTYNGEPIYFQPDSPTPHMIIYGNGKVAIGLDDDSLGFGTPERKFHVNGGAQIRHLTLGTGATYQPLDRALTVQGDSDLKGVLRVGNLTVGGGQHHFIVEKKSWFGDDIHVSGNLDLTQKIALGLPFGTNPQHPIHHASGAKLTAGGQWINASSRENKKDIEPLTLARAAEALKGLDPVEFKYKAEDDDSYIGFIAEDVPDLVATKDRLGLSPMDIVAVLTKVVQNQQSLLEEQQKVLEKQNQEIEELKSRIGHLQ